VKTLGVDNYIVNTAATAADLDRLPRTEILPAAATAPKKTQAQRLVELVPDAALFRSTDGETAFVTIPMNGHL
jgi:hypothetical protein